jgi:ABC-type amino acid transport substrate-binding protein
MQRQLAIILLTVVTVVFSEPYKVYTENLIPFNYKENDTLKGLSVELIEELFRRVNEPLSIQVYPWARAYKSALTSKKTVLFSTARSGDREELFNWVGPLFCDTSYFYQKSDNPIKISSWNDAKDVDNILVVRGFPEMYVLKEAGFENIEETNSQQSSMNMVMQNRAELFVIGSSVAKEIAGDIGIQYEDIKKTVSVLEMNLYIALSKDIPEEVVLEWQQVLDEIKSDGTYDSIANKYLKRVAE